MWDQHLDSKQNSCCLFVVFWICVKKQLINYVSCFRRCMLMVNPWMGTTAPVNCIAAVHRSVWNSAKLRFTLPPSPGVLILWKLMESRHPHRTFDDVDAPRVVHCRVWSSRQVWAAAAPARAPVPPVMSLILGMIEWHLRRKSYGFEKMSPPENRSIFRVDASTDSGLGRSGEQLGNWSPTERTAASANGPGSTIIHFGRQQPSPPDSPNEAELSKRHSIAVEETWRDIRKTSQVSEERERTRD